MHTKASQKAQLRRHIRMQGQALSPSSLAASNQSLEAALMALPEWNAAKRVFLYLSMGVEPETRNLVRRAWAQGKQVAAPRCLPGGKLEARLLVPSQGIPTAAGPYGIPQPLETAPLLLPQAMQLVLVPCLAADQHGFRLGQGGGYYDRFLPQVSCPTLCLCRDVLLLDTLPLEPWDFPVSLVVTETRVFSSLSSSPSPPP